VATRQETLERVTRILRDSSASDVSKMPVAEWESLIGRAEQLGFERARMIRVEQAPEPEL